MTNFLLKKSRQKLRHFDILMKNWTSIIASNIFGQIWPKMASISIKIQRILIKFEFDSEKAENLIQGIGQNSQVLESWQLPTVISSIKQSGVIESVRLNELFNNNNLTSFIETDDSQE